jgi:hypothetical protein
MDKALFDTMVTFLQPGPGYSTCRGPFTSLQGHTLTIKPVYTTTLYRNDCYKPGQYTVKCMCLMGIDLPAFTNFLLNLRTVLTVLYFCFVIYCNIGRTDEHMCFYRANLGYH